MRFARVLVVRIEAEDSPLAQMVEGEIACDGEEPGLEAGVPVVGATALQNAQPCFLDKIIHGVAAPEQVDEVADKTELILLNQVVQEGDVSLT